MSEKLLTPLESFSELTVYLNKLNKLFMSNIENELQRNGIYELNAAQALMLVNIGKNQKKTLVKATNNGYNLGKNTSYSVNFLLNNGYIIKEIGGSDKRCVYLRVTKKGALVIDLINQQFSSHQQSLTKAGIADKFILDINSIIDKLLRVLDNNSRI